MWPCVTFGSSNCRHAGSQSVQFVGAGSMDSSRSNVSASLYGLILGCVRDEFPDMNDLKSEARSKIPAAGSPDISDAIGRKNLDTLWFLKVSALMSISLSTVKFKIPPLGNSSPEFSPV